MNKEFVRPAVLLLVTIVAVGIIAAIIPGCDNKTFPIKKMKWFEALGIGNKGTGTETAIDPVILPQSDSDLTSLQRFQRELRSLGRSRDNSIRIAYYGDSIIEGDLITGMLRHSFQSDFGGSGVGFVPITSIVSGFRPTIRHSFSKNWEVVSFMTRGKYNVPLGMSGHTFIPRPYYIIEKQIDATLDTLATIDTTYVPVEKEKSRRVYVNTRPWVKYQAAGTMGGAASFDRIRLFYSNAGDSSFVWCSLDDQPLTKHYLRSGEQIQTLELNSGAQVKTVYLEFEANDPIHVHGVSFDQERGVYVDSFTIRGYSGMYFERIPQHYLSSFQKALDYDLIILHYGENVSHPKIRDYSYYYRGMTKTIQHIKTAMPDVPILLISAHGRSIKENGNYVTSPDIPILVATQAEIAKDMGCAFWNLYDSIGGEHSMADYVQKGFAQKDYTHFTRKGADHIGQLLYEMITKAD